MQMSLDITDSVGDTMPDGSSSANTFDDVLVIQYLLNQSGLIAGQLQLDGSVTPELIQAIMDFENAEPTVPDIDGRIDPFDEAWQALNAIPLSQFEGIVDRQEQRMIIQRPFPEWNFTRGSFKSLTDAGVDLFFHTEHSAWLPDTLKNRLFLILSVLLDPEIEPAPTFGVHPSDWCHVHLGLYSGQENVSVSPEALLWREAAVLLQNRIRSLRNQHHTDPAMFKEVMTQLMNSPEAGALLNTYAQLPQAVMVHHTFELEHWRPPMDHTDPRRQWMVNTVDNILTPPYRDHDDMKAANDRGEFICEISLQLSMLIDTNGIIHPVLGIPDDLMIYSGFELFIPDHPPGPPLT
jgi:hypothetical protein